jgi:hypothetical protein
MNLSLPVTQTNNAQNQPSTTHPEPDKRTPLLRGGKFPSGWEAPDQLRHVAKALWQCKEENRRIAVSIEGDSGDDANNDMGIAVAAEICDMPDSFLESHVYLLAWYKFGSLGAAWMNLAPPTRFGFIVGAGDHEA